MKDKELVKFFLSDADEYYGLKEKKEEIIKNNNVDNNKNGGFFSFPRRKFIISSVVSCLLLVGAGFGIGYLIKGLDNNSFKYNELYVQSSNAIEKYFLENYNNQRFINIYSINLNDNEIFGFYENENKDIIIYQCYSLTSTEKITVSFENSRTSQKSIITKEVCSYNQISILNNSNFEIIANDVIYGEVYVDTNFVKNITINF
ncbi:unknown [Firmicutes bacterium CAG:449]|nr:unknown [Firmicutes bacterium CAG:449]